MKIYKKIFSSVFSSVFFKVFRSTYSQNYVDLVLRDQNDIPITLIDGTPITIPPEYYEE